MYTKIDKGDFIFWVKNELAVEFMDGIKDHSCKMLRPNQDAEYQTPYLKGMMLCEIVLNKKTGELVKCRFNPEDLVDAYMRRFQ